MTVGILKFDVFDRVFDFVFWLQTFRFEFPGVRLFYVLLFPVQFHV